MTIAYEVGAVALFLFVVVAKFIADAVVSARQKQLWFRAIQVAYLALVVLLGVKIAPLAWPYIQKILQAR